jgi:flagellar biogenesis protein FliO
MYSQAIAVLLVLGLLCGVLYALRVKGLAAFQAPRRSRLKTMQVIERLSLTNQVSLHLVEVEGRRILVAASPAGCCRLDGASAPSGSGGLL